MRPTFWTLIWAPTLALCLAAGPVHAKTSTAIGAAAPQDADVEARTHFERGVELFEEGDYRSAVFEFETAHGLSGNNHLLYNIAVCRDELHEYAAAMQAYRQYLQTLGPELDAARVEKVEQELGRLEARVGTLTVESTPAGATVVIGGKEIGQTPLSIPRDLGQVEIELRLEGFDRETRSASVVSGDETRVEVELAEVGAAPTAPAPTANPKSATSTETGSADQLPDAKRVRALRTGAIVSLAIAGGAGVAAGVFGGLAVSSNNALEDERMSETTRGELDDLGQARDNRALATDILLAVTGVAAVTSLALGIAHLRGKKRLEQRSAALDVGPGGLRVRF